MSENEKLASAADLFPATPAKRRYKIVDLPVSKNRVRIQSLMEREQSEYEMAVISQTSGRSKFVRARLLDANRRLMAMCLVDADGNRLLTDNQAGKLATWDTVDTNYLHDECAAHTGISREAVEELVKNSVETSDASPPIASLPK